MTTNNKPYGTLRCTVERPDGTVRLEHEQDIDSFVVQYLQLLRAIWGNQRVSGVTDTNSTDRTAERGADAIPPMRWVASTGETDRGIVIGSDSTAEAIDDDSLGSKLTSSIDYGSASFLSVATGGGAADINITRSFTNNTGSDVDVNEVGMIARHEDPNDGTQTFLCLRDTGSPIVNFSNGETLTVDYEIEVSV